MRILIDEHFDVRLHRCFEADFVAETVQFRGWKGLKNGELLRKAAAEYDAFLTNDQGIPHQQDLQMLDLRIIVLVAPSNDIAHHRPLISTVCDALRGMSTGEVRYVTPES